MILCESGLSLLLLRGDVRVQGGFGDWSQLILLGWKRLTPTYKGECSVGSFEVLMDTEYLGLLASSSDTGRALSCIFWFMCCNGSFKESQHLPALLWDFFLWDGQKGCASLPWVPSLPVSNQTCAFWPISLQRRAATTVHSWKLIFRSLVWLWTEKVRQKNNGLCFRYSWNLQQHNKVFCSLWNQYRNLSLQILPKKLKLGKKKGRIRLKSN